MRRAGLISALILALPATGRAALTRVEVVSAPLAAPTVAINASAAAISAPSLTAAMAPALSAAFAAPMLSVQPPAAPQIPAAVLAIMAQAQAQPEATRAESATHVLTLTEDADGRPTATITLKTVAAAHDDAGRLFDAAPAAPNFEMLSPVRTPQAPEAWRPNSVLLKPVAAAVNAWRGARFKSRLANPPIDERVTTEEFSLRDTLTNIHEAASAGRFQQAITGVADYFQTRAASAWYAENPGYSPYRVKALDYMRFAERAVLKAYGRAHARAGDPALIAEARAASASGRILGHGWRPTALQEKDSSYCVQNALFNAIDASVGFARPMDIFNFVAASRASLNRAAKFDRPVDSADMAKLAHTMGLSFGSRDVSQGMDRAALADWSTILGMKLAARGPPSDEAGWNALLAPGRETLLSFRMFHPKFAHTEDERLMRGHDYRVIHHEVYLLGAFDSPSRGVRLFMVQDSGSGRTLLATAEELTALTMEAQVVTPTGPVAVPLAADKAPFSTLH